MAISMCDIDWVYLDPARPGGVEVGDMVSAEAGGLPIYCVTRLEEGVACLKGMADEREQRLPLRRLRWKARGAARSLV